ncbi:MAG: alanine--tRNA ligase [Vibrionaceae bacterium]
MYMSTEEIRRAFLQFFATKGHAIVDSSSLVPHNDPTLLFTNAGMNQFKDCFLGLERRDYTKATSAQRCVRAGGKHNDLENVGFTARHHTFFEMLGNFSFGDYFKEDAIRYAWEFLTQVLQLPVERLLVTVYATDDEAFAIWHEKMGLPVEKIIRIGDKKGGKAFESDNFWQMGDTGPCGPCTEIFFDHGAHIAGGPPGSPEEDGDRFIEIWNNVFMQYNRHADGTMTPLPAPSVDTGMGIERISAIMQGVHSNYEIDIFQELIGSAAQAIGCERSSSPSLQVVADHIRSCAYLIADGVIPSNEGRGYVLRRIIRRAIRHGNKLGATGPFFYKLVAPLIKVMGSAAQDLQKQQELVEKVLRIEEENFVRTLERGMNLLNEALDNTQGKQLDGKIVFKLYDTYGFPADLTNDVARERGFSIDQEGFDQAMLEQRERARAAGQFGIDYNNKLNITGTTCFTGYDALQQSSKICQLFVDGQAVEELACADAAQIVLDETPFYAESGGQCGDSGILQTQNATFIVENTQKVGSAVVHYGKLLHGNVKLGEQVEAQVDSARRAAIAQNHSATHLLHAALRQTLGEHVQQKGSQVNADGLRFDFSHLEAVTSSQLQEIEALVNAQIRRNHQIATELMDIEAAKAKGAMALFGEKYDATVRVLTMGDFSTELCGGTHATRTGDLGLFKILSEGAIAAGVRRIEAVTGEKALAQFYSQQDDFSKKIGESQLKVKALEKELAQLKDKLAAQQAQALVSQAKLYNGKKVLIHQLDSADPKLLRTMTEEIRNQLGSGVVFLSYVEQEKVSLIAGVTRDLCAEIKANELVNLVALPLGGKGGGRPDLAQAGAGNVQELQSALAQIEPWLKQRL